MRLISCYIENFGRLAQYDIDFSDGLTMIEEPNGFGKSTLAAFICTMFYGMPRSNKKLNKDVRKHYTPWQGGSFGGNLVFEAGGTEYRIERFFGKRPAQDTFELYEMGLNKKSTAFSENVGLEMFGLDVESFERSTYMPQMFNETSLSTTSIQAKLNDLVEDTNDVNNLESALNALRNKRSQFQQYRGNTGAINEVQGRITKLSEALEIGDIQREKLEKTRREHEAALMTISNIETELAQVRERITEVSKAEATQARKREYQNLKLSYTENEEQLKQHENIFPKGIPDKNEADKIMTIAREADELEAGNHEFMNGYNENEAVLAGYKNQFGDEMPSEESFSRMDKLNRDYIETISARSQTGLTTPENEIFNELECFFRNGIPSENIISDMQDKLKELDFLNARMDYQRLTDSESERYNELRQENIRRSAAADNKTDEVIKKSRAVLPVLVLGVILIIVGAVLMALKVSVPGIAVIAAGIISLIIAVCINISLNTRLKRERQQKEQSIQSQKDDFLRLQERMEEIERNKNEILIQLSRLEQELKSSLAQYFDVPKADYRSINEIIQKRDRFLELKNRRAIYSKKRNDLSEKADCLMAEITSFLKQYYYEDIAAEQFTAYLSKLRSSTDAYRKALKAKSEADKIKMERETRCKALTKSLIDFFDRCGMEACYPYQDKLRSINEDLKEIERLRQACNNAENRISNFIEANSDIADILEADISNTDRFTADTANIDTINIDTANADIPNVDMVNAVGVTAMPGVQTDTVFVLNSLNIRENELLEELNSLRREALNLKQQEDNLHSEIDVLVDKQDELDEKKCLLEEYKHKCTMLDETIAMLETARDNLMHSYLGPIKQSFIQYTNELIGEDIGKVYLDTKLDVAIERGGAQREIAYFSTGYADIIMICMRFALIDALFKEESPFVIMDDPFVNLDDEYTAKALELIGKLAEKQQIVYLVCNSSRAIR